MATKLNFLIYPSRILINQKTLDLGTFPGPQNFYTTTMGNSGKSNNFCPKYMPPLSEFSHCFCPNLPLLLPEFAIAFTRNSAKNNGKFGQKQWEILGKSNEKTRKAAGYISGKNYGSFGQFHELTLFSKLIYFLDQIKILKDLAFCPKFPIIIIYLKILYFRLGREHYEQIRACYCEQV